MTRPHMRTVVLNGLNSIVTINEAKKLENKVELEDNNINEIVTDLVKLITPDNTSKRKQTTPSKKKVTHKKWYDKSCQEVSKRLKNCAKL